MRGRLSSAGRKRALEEAAVRAVERAHLFRIGRRTGKGEPLTGHKLIAPTGERHRRNLVEKGYQPVLSSSAWREIYEEVGLS